MSAQTEAALTERAGHWLVMGARLRPDVSLPQAVSELEAIGRDLDRENPTSSRPRGLRLVPSSVVPGNRTIVAIFLAVLMTIVSLVLIVACANVSAVLLARAAARRREIARTPGHRSGARAAGAAAADGNHGAVRDRWNGGTGAGVWLMPLVVARLPSLPVPVSVSLALDGRVIAFTMLVSLGAALLSGLVPALQASKTQLAGTLKDDSHGSPRGSRLRNAFVLAQVALSILLVVVAGLFVRALARAGSTDPGFDPRTASSSRRWT